MNKPTNNVNEENKSLGKQYAMKNKVKITL
jgi:hypothetical protein